MIETAEKPDWALASFFTLTLSGNSGRGDLPRLFAVAPA